MRGDSASDDDGADRARPLDAVDPQSHVPVVDQHVVPRLEYLADRGRADRQVDAGGPVAVGADHDLVAAGEHERLGKVGHSELRALEVGDERERLAAALCVSRTSRALRACSSCVPCEKFSRAASMPAPTSASIRPLEAGPIVARIFVRRGAGLRGHASESS